MEAALIQGGGKSRLHEILDQSHPGIVEAAIAKLRKSASAMFLATHICSISEHRSPEEDRIGRLSMWRAYGGSSGVAIVFNNKALFSDSNALSVYSSPVIYKEPQKFAEMFDHACETLATNSQFIATQPTDLVATNLYEMLHFAVLSTKHPAFIEEAEWRLIHAPYYERSDRVKGSTETINGLPQLVYKLPLQNIPHEGLTGLETAESLDRIIIGPTNHPDELSFVFHEALREQGIEKSYEKIVISGVPLRLPA